MFNMRNKDNVRITESFGIYLWSIDHETGIAYKIAMKDWGNYLYETDFSVGSVISLFVTAVDTYTIQRHSRYSV